MAFLGNIEGFILSNLSTTLDQLKEVLDKLREVYILSYLKESTRRAAHNAANVFPPPPDSLAPLHPSDVALEFGSLPWFSDRAKMVVYVFATLLSMFNVAICLAKYFSGQVAFTKDTYWNFFLLCCKIVSGGWDTKFSCLSEK